ncbi:hypothetical protein DFJ73DRAFT_836828 [Zopfochytrium polystomum]|nr:hypothetical protein DFJ73DRAFT_836828 [Zopfochytrium polystomum]
MASEGADEDFSSLPLSDRLVHKSWKARQGAYDELTKRFKTLDPDADAEYRKHQDSLKKMLADANAIAQEAGVTAVLAYVENAPSAAKTRPILAPVVAEKCLGSSRVGTKTKGQELLLMFIEVENKADGVVEDILPSLDHKTPKNVVATVNVLKEAVRLFGIKVVNVKPIIKQLPKLFDHKDKTVRAEAQGLTVQLYRWLGSALLPSLQDLKPVQLKELSDLFESLPPERAVPERLVRADQEKVQAGVMAPPEEEAGPAAPVEVELDPYDLADPVNVLDKLPSKFYSDLAATKWSDRKEALEGLMPLIKFPKLEDGRYGELLNALAKRVNDANIVVAALAINCIEYLARGLRQLFGQYRVIVTNPLLEKLKERKQSVIEALRSALDALFLSVTFTEILEDLVAAAGHKNPQVRSEAIQWLVRSLKVTRKPPAKPEIKALGEVLLKSLDDSDANVRDAGAEALGTLMKVVTERALASIMERVDKSKEAKVREYFDKAEVKTGGGGRSKPAAAPPSAGPSRSSAVKTALGKENEPPPLVASSKMKASQQPTSALPPKKKPAMASKESVQKESAPKKKQVAKEEEPLKFKFTEDSASAWVTESFGGSFAVAELSDSNWKTRLSASNGFLEAIKAKSHTEVEAEAVITYLAKSPGWKESNFQVMTSVINILGELSKCPSFTKAAATVATPVLVDKLGDAKLKKVASDCLFAFAEAVSFGFVLTLAYEPLRKAKSPKILSDGLLWIHQSVMEFGAKGISIKELLEFLKSVGLANSNAAVRTSSISLLGALRLFLGPDIRTLLADANPQQLTLIDAEFEKMAAREPPKITRTQAGTADAVQESADDLIPRVDLTSAISAQLLEKLSDAQWKTRKEALDEIQTILNAANKKVKPNLGELIPALKARLSDSNKNLAMNAVEICGVLAISVGKPFDRPARILLPSMMGLLSDQKNQVRAAAITAMDQVFAAVGLDPFLTSGATALAVDNPQLRKDLLKFLSDKAELAKSSPDYTPSSDVHQLVQPLLACLQDKNSDVRKNGSVLLGWMSEEIGLDLIRDRASDLYKGTALTSLTPFFDAVRTKGGVAPPTKRPGSPASKRATVIGLSSIDSGALSASSSASALPMVKSKLPSTSSKLRRPVSMMAAASSKDPTATQLDVKESRQLFLTGDFRGKEVRASQDRGPTKWVFEAAARRDLVDFLNDQCKEAMTPNVVSLMFSNDHYKEKDFISALTLMDDAISGSIVGDRSPEKIDERNRVFANSDLILKYLTIRFFDTNTSILIKSLEIIDHLFTLLDQEGWMLSDYEANSFFPYFIQKVGDNKETIRAKIRAILRQSGRVFPTSKLFNFILDALKSKNSRTRGECLEELGDLVKRNGLTVCGPSNGSKTFPIIAAQISDSDAKVRNAALGAISQAYVLVGDAVYKLVGRLSDKDKSLLEEKLKRVPLPASLLPPPEPEPEESYVFPGAAKLNLQQQSTVTGPTPASNRDGVRREFALDMNRLRPSNARPNMPSPPTKADGTGGHGDALVSPTAVEEGTSLSPGSSLLLDFVVTQITSGEVDQSIDALKQLERCLSNGGGSSGSPDPVLLEHLNDAVSAITLQIRIAFTSASPASSGPFNRLCRHLINSLVQIFSSSTFANSVGPDPLGRCIRELLTRLLDPRLASGTDESDGQISRALNVLMVRVLENADKNCLFRVLLSLLQESATETLTASPQEVPTQVKFTELVMKCVWKMTKIIPQLIDRGSLDVSSLIETVHNFLKITPPAEWKRRTAEKVMPQADMPLRTVKTILHELVSELGEKVMEKTDKIDDPARSPAVMYLRQMLDQARKKTGGAASVEPESYEASAAEVAGSTSTAETQARPAPIVAWINGISSGSPETPSSFGNRTPRASSLTDEEADMQLTLIFSRISQKDETKQGIADLYAFRKKFPEHEEVVQKHLLKTGTYFQGYIKRGLATLAQADEEKERAEAEKKTRSSFSGAPSGYSQARSSFHEPRGEDGIQLVSGQKPEGITDNLISRKQSDSGQNGATADKYKETLTRMQQQLGFMKYNTEQEPTIPVNVEAGGEPSVRTPGRFTARASGIPSLPSSMSPMRPASMIAVPTSSTVTSSGLVGAIPPPSHESMAERLGLYRASSGSTASPRPKSFGAGGLEKASSIPDSGEFRRFGQFQQNAPPLLEAGQTTGGALASSRPAPQTVEQLKRRLAAMKEQQQRSSTSATSASSSSTTALDNQEPGH